MEFSEIDKLLLDQPFKIPNEQFESACRTCLRIADPPTSLFHKENDEMLADLLWMCTGIQFTQGDGLPEVLCPKCHAYLSTVSQFKNRVHQTNQLLQKYIQRKIQMQLDERLKVELSDISSVSYDESKISTESFDGYNINDVPTIVELESVKIELDPDNNLSNNIECNEVKEKEEIVELIDSDTDPKNEPLNKEPNKSKEKNKVDYKFKCKFCNLFLSTEYALEYHSQLMHAEEKKSPGDKSNHAEYALSATKNSTLTQHMNDHTDRRSLDDDNNIENEVSGPSYTILSQKYIYEYYDPPGRPNENRQQHKSIRMLDEKTNPNVSRVCRVCAAHQKQEETFFMCQICLVPLHRGGCFNAYHTKKNFK